MAVLRHDAPGAIRRPSLRKSRVHAGAGWHQLPSNRGIIANRFLEVANRLG
jgi:hypothetical protein